MEGLGKNVDVFDKTVKGLSKSVDVLNESVDGLGAVFGSFNVKRDFFIKMHIKRWIEAG